MCPLFFKLLLKAQELIVVDLLLLLGQTDRPFKDCFFDSVGKLKGGRGFVPGLRTSYMYVMEGDTQMMSLILPEPRSESLRMRVSLESRTGI